MQERFIVRAKESMVPSPTQWDTLRYGWRPMAKRDPTSSIRNLISVGFDGSDPYKREEDERTHSIIGTYTRGCSCDSVSQLLPSK